MRHTALDSTKRCQFVVYAEVMVHQSHHCIVPAECRCVLRRIYLWYKAVLVFAGGIPRVRLSLMPPFATAAANGHVSENYGKHKVSY